MLLRRRARQQLHPRLHGVQHGVRGRLDADLRRREPDLRVQQHRVRRAGGEGEHRGFHVPGLLHGEFADEGAECVCYECGEYDGGILCGDVCGEGVQVCGRGVWDAMLL